MTTCSSTVIIDECDPYLTIKCDHSSDSSCDNHKHKKCKDKSSKCYKFSTIVEPAKNLQPSLITFRMAKICNSLIFQWPDFSGHIAVNGVGYVAVNQSVISPPCHKVNQAIAMLYNGGNNTGIVEVTDMVRFYFFIDKSGSSVEIGDSFDIYGGSITWIIN